MNDAGKVAFTPKGDYSSTVTYEYLDTVVYNGNAYVALKTTAGNVPTDSDTDENWKLLARGGTSVPTATEEVKGTVMASSDIGVAETGKMVLKTDYTSQETLEELTSGEDRTNFFGKIAKAVSTLITHVSATATTSILGHVKLTNSVSSTSTTTAAVPANVKAAYDKAEAALPKANISQSSAISVTGAYALDAVEKNASVSGTLAYDIANCYTREQIQSLLSPSSTRPTLANSTNFMFLGSPLIIKSCGIAILTACVQTKTTYTAGTPVLLLPSGFNGPITNVACAVSGQNSGVTGATINENGYIRFTSDLAANTWVIMNIAYPVAN